MVSNDFSVIFLLGNNPKNKVEFSSILVKIFDSQSQLVRLAKALTDHEIENTPDPDIIFRGNTMVTKSLDALMKLVGSHYLDNVLAPILSDICSKKGKSYEIDPDKADKKQNLSKNKSTLISLCETILNRIYESIDECPE